MVLGAGLGTRLRPFTNLLPKPLIPVMGIPCMDYALYLLHASQVKEVVVNVHAHPSLMNQHLAQLSGLFSRQSSDPFKITVSDESSELLGSAGGFRKALPQFKGEAFFGINADVICALDLSQLARRHEELRRKHGVVMTLALAHGKTLAHQTESYREILTDESTGLITGFGEKKSNVPFYTGLGVFESEAFSGLPADVPLEFVPEVLEPWIKKNKVGFLEYDGLWLDIGTPALWWSAHEQLKKNLMLEHALSDSDSLPLAWREVMQNALQSGKVQINQPWEGWIKYGKDATPQNFLGKRGIQLDNLVYELPL